MNKKLHVLRLAFVCCCLLFVTQVFAQQIHYIYIQSDDKQSFTVSVNGKTYTASEAGYVIIPKLTDATYNLTVSFPGNKFPDQQFVCIVDKSDAGYALKNFAEKGWALFNFQSLELTMAGAGVAVIAKNTAPSNTFGDMLSEVVDDSTLNKAEPQPEKKTEEAVNNTDALADATPVADAKAIVPAAVVPAVVLPVADVAEKTNDKTEIIKPVAIIKLFELDTKDGTEVVFADTAGGAPDTIRIFIPKQTTAAVQAKDTILPAAGASPDANMKLPAKEVTGVQNEEVLVAAAASGAVSNPFYNKTNTTEQTVQKSATENAVNNTTAAGDKNTELTPEKAAVAAFSKKECKKMLSVADLDKVRHKMFLSADDKKMTDAALKMIGTKCVTVQQLKEMGILFPSDEGRFNFFAAAFPLVDDAATFGSLESQLIAPEYKKRLAAMLK